MTSITPSQDIMISMIAAIASNNAIGKNNQLPWPYCAEDMEFFKKHTRHKSVIMGYRTFISLNSTPLPHRYNVVIQTGIKQPTTLGKELVFVGDLSQALQLAQQYALTHHQSEIMIIGGGSVYKQFLPLAQRLYITHFSYAPSDADVFFPDFSVYRWRQQELQTGIGSNGLRYRMIRYDKIDCTE